jgi:hypothetical protein
MIGAGGDARMIGASGDARLDAQRDALAARLVAVLPRRPHLLQIGGGNASCAGTADPAGAFTWLAPRLHRAQVWHIIDQDAELVQERFHRIAAWATGHGLTVTAPGRAMLVHHAEGAWRIEGSATDLDDPAGFDVERADLVICDGLLPVVSQDWLLDLLDVWQGPLLATANIVAPITLVPPDPLDARVLRAFARPREIDVGFGTPMATRAMGLAMQALRARGDELLAVAWEWRTRGGDLRWLRHWLDEAALAAPPPAAARFDAWRALRLRQALAGRLVMRVPIRDLLALPAQA